MTASTVATTTTDAAAMDITTAIDPSIDTRTPNPDHRVPVTEAIRYRKRAQAAEQQLGDVQSKLTAAESELAQTRQTIASLERRQKIDALLADADTMDVEVARLLTEAAVEVMAEPDVRTAIEELRRSKPYLFRQRSGAFASAGAPAGAMPARGRGGDSASTSDAAQVAAGTGDRRDLLTYLRLRRNGSRAAMA